MAEALNYFVCNLGQAAEHNASNPHSFTSVNALIEIQAKTLSHHPAVAFHRPQTTQTPQESPDEKASFDVYSFKDLYNGSIAAARHFQSTSLQPFLRQGQVVALVCQSTPVFLFTWLGLMRAGCSVLLIAPQCQPTAVAHLCRTCEAKAILFDPVYSTLAKDSACNSEIECLQIPFDWQSLPKKLLVESDDDASWPQIGEHDVAYLHHTSGTSSGLPKPIPQTHRAAVGVLPCLKGSDAATFTTTPLYHGGIADCFRSWTSGALIWLFPGSIPITSKNILTSITLADQAASEAKLPPVRYFSSVPYILQMLAGDDQGLRRLQSLDIVGVGGAALPEDAGNDLVKNGVNLISRFGSAECGFLMSSYREFKTDKAWQHLRPGHGSKLLTFEPQEDGLCELVVQNTWPHLAKTNREDGSFASADLFEPHSSILDAWRYHSRADSQLTLITGKKFDPAPLEDSIALSSLLSDVLVFGNGRQYPGSLVWRSTQAQNLSAEDILQDIWPEIERLNQKAQSHAKISKPMVIVMPREEDRPERSSKGTLLRKPVEQRYHSIIEDAYNKLFEQEDQEASRLAKIPDQDVQDFVKTTIQKVANGTGDLSVRADLFTQGVDSVACMQIRNVFARRLTPGSGSRLPLNVVYDCGTIEKLAKFLIAYRNGETLGGDDEINLMQQMVEKYGSFGETSQSNSSAAASSGRTPEGKTYLLTGATGALGAHVLDQLLIRQDTVKVFCLVRGADEHASFERVSKSLQHRKRAPIERHSGKVVCLPTKLGEDRLGLSTSAYEELASQVDVVIHAAWAVNFSARLPSFEADHIRGVRNLISFALSGPEQSRPPRLIFCSSTASVINSKTTQPGIPEELSTNPLDASSLGYSRSKWVAESICAKAAQHPRLKSTICVARVGQLCGDTKNGVWNMSEAWPLMLSASNALSAIPDLGPEPLRWLPVDLAAEALLRISDELGRTSPNSDSLRIFHVLRQTETNEPTWNDVIQWCKSETGPDPLWVVPLSRWVEMLQELKEDHPAKRLLNLWKTRAAATGHGRFESESDGVWFDQSQMTQVYPELNEKGLIDRELFGKLWQWIQNSEKGDG